MDPHCRGTSDKSSGQPKDRNYGVGAGIECTRIARLSAEVTARRGLTDLYLFGGNKQIVNTPL
jgi:hypothetical protein